MSEYKCLYMWNHSRKVSPNNGIFLYKNINYFDKNATLFSIIYILDKNAISRTNFSAHLYFLKLSLDNYGKGFWEAFWIKKLTTENVFQTSWLLLLEASFFFVQQFLYYINTTTTKLASKEFNFAFESIFINFYYFSIYCVILYLDI